MDEILTAWATLFEADTSDAFYSALTGRFYAYYAGENETYPYGTFSIQGQARDTLFAGQSNWIDDVVIKVDLFDEDDDPTNILQAAEHCKTMYHGVSLTALAGDTLDNCGIAFESSTFVDEPERGENDVTIWHYVLMFQLYVGLK